MIDRRHIVSASVMGLLGGGAMFFGAKAQAVSKLVHMIVGFPAGGGTDITARVLAEALLGTYASTLIVENKVGASARIAVEYVKNALPDGSVMLFTPDFPMTLYPHSFKSLSYDPLTDFITVSPAAKGMLTFVVGPAVPESAKTLADFLQWCRSNPDKASYATTSAGATPHFTGVMLSSEAAIPMTPVRYRGGAPAIQDLVGGHVPASINPVSEVIEFANSGSLRNPRGDRREALAVSTRCPHHEGARLQRYRKLIVRRVPTGKYSRRDRSGVERRDARGLTL